MPYTYYYWKKKWDNPSERPLFGSDPSYPSEVDEECVIWKKKDSPTWWHRLDGPATIWIDDSMSYWINDYQVAYQADGNWSGLLAKWADEQNIDLGNLSDEDKTLIKLVWAGFTP